MKNLLLFELKKMTKSLYFIVMIMLLTAFISFYFIYSYVQTERVSDYIASNETLKSSNQLSMEHAGNDEEKEFFTNEIAELDKLSEAARKHDWTTILNYEIAIAESFVTELPSQKEEDVYSWPTHFTYEVVYKKNKWIKEHDIKPVFPIHINSEITAYDRAFDRTPMDEEFAYYFFNKHDSSSVYFVNLLLGIGLSIGGIIFFLFLFGDIITKEGLNRNGSLYLLDTQPLKRWKVMLSKFISIILLTIFILVGTSLFATLLGIVFDRFGDWDYPVLIYEPDFSFRFIELGYFILLSLLLFFIVLIFCYGWLFLYSVLIKRTFMAIVFTVITVVFGTQVSGTELAMGQPLAPVNPFNYFHMNDIITMETALTSDNFHFTLWNGVLSLVISSIILFGISYLIFRRRAK